jgi:hypothetical protein
MDGSRCNVSFLKRMARLRGLWPAFVIGSVGNTALEHDSSVVHLTAMWVQFSRYRRGMRWCHL